MKNLHNIFVIFFFLAYIIAVCGKHIIIIVVCRLRIYLSIPKTGGKFPKNVWYGHTQTGRPRRYTLARCATPPRAATADGVNSGPTPACRHHKPFSPHRAPPVTPFDGGRT